MESGCGKGLRKGTASEGAGGTPQEWLESGNSGWAVTGMGGTGPAIGKADEAWSGRGPQRGQGHSGHGRPVQDGRGGIRDEGNFGRRPGFAGKGRVEGERVAAV